MTYCVGLMLNAGLVMMSDTMTNAGVDNISRYRKTFHWSIAGERQIFLMTSGNLATSQAVVSALSEREKSVEEREPSILEVPSMFQVAKLVGATLRETIRAQAETGQRSESEFNSTLILSGQIIGGKHQLYLIYPEGNFIEVSEDMPFFQIGETKYGKPILVRTYDPAMRFEAAIKMLLISFDSTMKANVSVGMPLDVTVYEKDSLEYGYHTRIDADDPYYRQISSQWGQALLNSFYSLPAYQMDS